MRREKLEIRNEKLAVRNKKIFFLPLTFYLSFLTSHLSPFIILLFATALRLAYLPTLPPGLNFDVAGGGVAALDILHGEPRIWWPIGGGKEPLWPYLIALSTAMLGRQPLAIKLPAVAISLLTIAVSYNLMRRLFPTNRWLALLTMLLLTLSEWQLHFSRLGFRAILLPLFATLAMSHFWTHRKNQTSQLSKTSYFSFLTFHFPLRPSTTALFLALAIYSYLAARLLPLILLFFTITETRADRFLKPVSSFRASVPSAWCSLAIHYLWLAIFLSPLVFYFIQHPDDFVARSSTVSIFNPTWNHGDLLGTLRQTTAETLGTFFGLTGDANHLVNLPHQPAIPIYLAPFFLIGLIITLYHSLTAPTPSPYRLLLTWWLIMLFPAILAPEGAPHHLRLLGTIVPTYALLAIGLHSSVSFVNRQLPIITTHYSPLTSHLSPLIFYFSFLISHFLFLISHFFILWPHSTDFTLPVDLYAMRLVEDIAHAPAEVTYIIPMDIRADIEARHYTIDYLLDTPYSHPPNLAVATNAPYMYLPVDEHNAEICLSHANHTMRVIRWTADKHQAADEKELLTYLLTTQATLLKHESFPVYDVDTWQRNPETTAFKLPAINQPMAANFDNLLRIDAAYIATQTIHGAWLPVAITLAPLSHMDVDYKVSFRLIAPNGKRVAQKDRTLRHNFHQGTSLWPPETVNEYYLLPLPPHLAPAQYTVVIVLYHPDSQAPLVANGLVEVPLGQFNLP